MNHDVDYEDISVSKIYSIKDSDKNEPRYADVLSKEHPFFVLLPKEITGQESIVDLSSVTTIHKNMLLEKKTTDVTDFLPLIDSKLEYCFKLGIHKKQDSSNENIG